MKRLCVAPNHFYSFAALTTRAAAEYLSDFGLEFNGQGFYLSDKDTILVTYILPNNQMSDLPWPGPSTPLPTGARIEILCWGAPFAETIMGQAAAIRCASDVRSL
jgi:hypothetical protein